MNRGAIYTGSFNPFHNGHLDIIRRASTIFDFVVVAVANNSNKSYIVSAEERATMIRAAINARDNTRWQDKIKVIILPEDEIVAEFAVKEEIDVIIRGIRNASDLDLENVMSAVNRDNGMETLYMPCDPKYSMISSSMIRECLHHNISIANYVPISIYPSIKEYYTL